MEGLQLGAYRIERKLGEGGMGVVYVGVDVRLGRRAAIKQLLPGLSSDRMIVERFFNEAKAAASIDHPGIVEIYDVGWHSDGSAYFAMKLLEGDSLATRLRARGPMPIQLAATIARQIASALAAAHARGIVHRDLKPDNIVLVPDEEVAIGERATVLDFGIAKLFGDGPMTSKTRTGSVMGTPYYMSPEQCRGAGEIDHRTDVYALGCLVFEMLTGRPPFVAEGAGEILGMHQFVEPPAVRSLRADAPPDLEALVMRSLAKRAEQRPQTMAELTAALQPFATQGARAFDQTPRPSSPHETRGPMAHALPSTISQGSGQITTGRRGLMVGLGGAVVVAAGIAIAIVASSGGGVAPTTTAAVAIDAATGTPPPATIDAAAPATVLIDAATVPPPVIDLGSGAPVDDPAAAAPDQRAFEALRAEIARNDYARAFKAWDGIAKTSPYRDRGRDLLTAAAAQAVRDAAWGRAFVIGERMLLSYPKDVELHKLAGIASCGAKNLTKAREHEAKLAKLPGSGEARIAVIASCPSGFEQSTGGNTGSGDPPPPDGAPPVSVDPAQLTSDAGVAAMNGQYGRSLSLAEQAMKAGATGSMLNKALTIATLAACNLKNEAKARQYYAKASAASKSMLRQRCMVVAKFDPGE